jgi:hypothetical protein
LKIGTGDKTTTNWPGAPTQNPSQADQIVTLATDPGRVYYVATDELGNFYVGDYFKVDQATGNVTLDASAFDLKGLESLQLGSLGGLIGASINEFSTDGDMVQNSDLKVPTQAAIRTYVGKVNATTPTGGTFAVTGNQTISGNLTVSGTTTTVSTTNTTISDQLLELGTGRTGAPSGDCGIIIERGDSNNAFIGYDESADKFILATTTATGASTGDLTLTQATLLADVQGTLTGNASSASDISGTPNITIGTLGCSTVTCSADITTTNGAITAAKFVGRLENLIASSQSGGYTTDKEDAGTIIRTTSNVTIGNGIYDAGDIISIYNNSGSDITITQSSTTLRKVGTADTGNITLAQRGLMTVTCVSSNEFVCSGGGMS